MRKLFVSEFITLDGVIEAPHEWSFPYWNDDIGQFKIRELFNSDGLLLGRVTYQGFAEAWPSRTDEDGFADRFNSFPKYVVSTTLSRVDWNNSILITNNVIEQIAGLKQQPGQDIMINGSGTLVKFLIKEDLIDEYHLLVYPIVLGKGIKLFNEGDQTNLKLVESKAYSTGVIGLIYQTIH